MIRLAIIGLSLALAVPAWSQTIEDPFTVIDPLDRDMSPRYLDDQLALGDEGPLTPETTIGIERELAALGYDPGTVDGVLDEDSRAAIRSFQSDRGDRPTGTASAGLYRRLRAMAVSPNASWVRPEDEAWLRGGAGPDPGLGGWKPGWLDGADAILPNGERWGTVEGFRFGPTGQVEAVGVRRQGGVVAVPRDHISVEDGRVVVVMPPTGRAQASPLFPPGGQR